VKYFLYLCIVRTDLQIDKKREGESPSETSYGLENKCHFRHMINLKDSDSIRTM
jgi:hypothetical protein